MELVRLIKKNRIHILGIIRLCRQQLGFLKRKFVIPKIPRNTDGKAYVNLGCGVNTSSEFTNVDARGFPHTHYIHDVRDLEMFTTESVDLLYASHILEHVPREEVKKTLKEWYRVLKKGGILRFGVPDFDGLVEVYTLSGKDVGSIVNQLMGADGGYDDHHTIWNFAYAKQVLEGVGFKDVHEWNPFNADHHDFIDKTMRTVKVGEKEVAISLNVEAIK